jgi:5'-nucleotidase
MSKKILYLDMDGVIANFDKGIKDICPDLQTSDEYPDYESRSLKVDSICEANPDIFHNLEPIEGAIDAVNKLFDEFDVYFLSTPMWNVPMSFMGKRIWLEKHFGEKAKKRLILTHRKDLNIGDYLVDDRTRNGAGEFTGEHIHFGTEAFPDWITTYQYLFFKNNLWV